MPGSGLAAPAPGDRYPDRARFRGTAHHVLLFGDAEEADLDRLRRRWAGLAEVARTRPAAARTRPGRRPRA